VRSYGRNANGQWVEITDTGYIWLATLAQCLRLQEGESPYFANYGLPARESVMSQIAPDAGIAKTQRQFAPYFSSLVVSRVAGAPVPTYNITAVFLNGEVIQSSVAT
jgi:hypothetical protein